MKVIEDARNRVKSNATGIGVGSRRAIVKLVHCLDAWSSSLAGSCPLLANNCELPSVRIGKK